jgi:DNA-directed RNA polymerase specialized sigma subunit
MGRKNYINNKDFLDALVEYRDDRKKHEENGEEPPMVPDYIGKSIYQIANRLATKPNFSGYSYKDEMISDGLENAIQAINNFDPDKSSNPFAYFTQIIWYAFLRRIEKEKKQVYIKHKVTENAMIHDTIVDKKSGESGEASYVDLDNDYMNTFVSTYEKRLETKKRTAAKKKGIENFIEDD